MAESERERSDRIGAPFHPPFGDHDRRICAVELDAAGDNVGKLLTWHERWGERVRTMLLGDGRR